MDSQNKYNKDDAYQTLNLINEWTRSSDTKTSILMAFISLLLGFTVTVFNGIKYIAGLQKITFLAVVIVFLLIVYILSAVTAIIFSCLSLCARIKYKGINSNSIFFFGDISNLSEEEFSSKTSSITEDNLLKDLKSQIAINSRIAKCKLKYFNLGLLAAFIQFCSAILLLLIVNIALV